MLLPPKGSSKSAGSFRDTAADLERVTGMVVVANRWVVSMVFSIEFLFYAISQELNLFLTRISSKAAPKGASTGQNMPGLVSEASTGQNMPGPPEGPQLVKKPRLASTGQNHG